MDAKGTGKRFRIQVWRLTVTDGILNIAYVCVCVCINVYKC